MTLYNINLRFANDTGVRFNWFCKKVKLPNLEFWGQWNDIINQLS